MKGDGEILIGRAAAIQRLSWAYLRTTLTPGDDAWARAREAYAALGEIGAIECK